MLCCRRSSTEVVCAGEEMSHFAQFWPRLWVIHVIDHSGTTSLPRFGLHRVWRDDSVMLRIFSVGTGNCSAVLRLKKHVVCISIWVMIALPRQTRQGKTTIWIAC